MLNRAHAHALEISRRAAFPLAALHELIEFGTYACIHGGLAVIGERLLVELVCLLPGFGLAGGEPLLVVAPVGNHRCIEGLLIARQRMGGTEEMTARPYFANGLDAERILIGGERLEELHHHLDEITVEDEFLEAGDQAPFQPARTMHDEIAPAHG